MTGGTQGFISGHVGWETQLFVLTLVKEGPLPERCPRGPGALEQDLPGPWNTRVRALQASAQTSDPHVQRPN